MLTIKGYEFFKTLYAGPETVVYGGIRIKDKIPVAAKLISEAYLSPRRLKRLEHEFEIGRLPNHPGIVKYYALENLGRTKALIMEDFGAVSLEAHLDSQRMTIEAFLNLAVPLVAALNGVNRSDAR